MEDLDTARVRSGCAAEILRTLEAFGLTWDGVVEYQSARTAHYAEALRTLNARGVTFECSCPRRVHDRDSGYPGTCRQGPTRPGPTATRFRIPDGMCSFQDRAQGVCAFSLHERGDVIIRRRDGTFAYQLAVVVDDALQGVTDVVRGADLLDSTPWQLALQSALALPTPTYLHLPLVVEPGGAKLAKSHRSVALNPASVARQLHEALKLLLQEPPAKLELEPASTVLEWGRRNWQPERFREVRSVPAGVSQGSA